MTTNSDYLDELNSRTRSLVLSVRGGLTDCEVAEVDEFIEHSEFGEALRTIAWIIRDEGKKFSVRQFKEISALAVLMGIGHDLPEDLSDHLE